MKILLSAYACEPGLGSEPGVGWNWAIELTGRGHEVWVLTSGFHHREGIEDYARTAKLPDRLNIVYCDLPWKFLFDRSEAILLRYAYAYAWQFLAYHMARRLHAKENFDLVHHVTWAGARVPSLMGRLGIPFILGPIGGGESAPWRLRVGYGWRGFVVDGLRDLSNTFLTVDPLVRRMFRQASWIYVTSEQTLNLLPRRYRSKAAIHLAIGLERAWRPVQAKGGLRAINDHAELRILFVGKFLYLKGMHLGLAAFRRLMTKVPNVRLTMVGQGPEEKRWRRLADRLGVANNVEWIPKVPRAELGSIYAGHDVFLFPSLHDPGGMVVLEALAVGLPVVCLDIGGPGEMVDPSCGRVIAVEHHQRQDVIRDIADALIELASDGALRQRLSGGAKERALSFDWGEQADTVYSPIDGCGTVVSEPRRQKA